MRYTLKIKEEEEEKEKKKKKEEYDRKRYALKIKEKEKEKKKEEYDRKKHVLKITEKKKEEYHRKRLKDERNGEVQMTEYKKEYDKDIYMKKTKNKQKQKQKAHMAKIVKDIEYNKKRYGKRIGLHIKENVQNKNT